MCEENIARESNFVDQVLKNGINVDNTELFIGSFYIPHGSNGFFLNNKFEKIHFVFLANIYQIAKKKEVLL